MRFFFSSAMLYYICACHPCAVYRMPMRAMTALSRFIHQVALIVLQTMQQVVLSSLCLGNLGDGSISSLSTQFSSRMCLDVSTGVLMISECSSGRWFYKRVFASSSLLCVCMLCKCQRTSITCCLHTVCMHVMQTIMLCFNCHGWTHHHSFLHYQHVDCHCTHVQH